MGSYLRNCISPYSNEEVFLKKTWKVLKIAMKDFDCHILVYVLRYGHELLLSMRIYTSVGYLLFSK